jgi:iron complex transport system ATP-binding protein
MIKGHQINYQSQNISILKGIDIKVGYGEFWLLLDPMCREIQSS